MEEREITFALSEDLYTALRQQQGDNLAAFVRQAVVEKLAALDSSEPVGQEERPSSPLLEKFTQGLQGKDIDQLVREARAESESRIVGQGVASLALFISEIMTQAITAPVGEEDRIPFPASLRDEATPAP